MPLAVRRAVSVDHTNRLFQHLAGKFLRVGDRGGGKDKLWMRTIKSAYPFEPPNYIGNMRTEHPAVSMNFINYHKSQVAQVLYPECVVRQDSHMQHIGVGQQDPGAFPDSRTSMSGCVAVIDCDFGFQGSWCQLCQGSLLILRQSFGWKQQQSSDILGEFLQV